MNKAYDRLEWNFLKKVLQAFGFDQRWVKITMECVKSASYRIKVNENFSKVINPQRGLGQGDPLSPYLFILAVEVFTILMEEAYNKGEITSFKAAPTAPSITHLLFADDCIVLAEARDDELYQIIQILNQYTKASG
ncbi:secreted RxLR effector protein 78-like [Arachis hypogaea]|uniref:secreted RxLR effector protein 78-like n=1 Tax=Arachis hypogaea TaxID=3818 RepID=UPI003B216435